MKRLRRRLKMLPNHLRCVLVHHPMIEAIYVPCEDLKSVPGMTAPLEDIVKAAAVLVETGITIIFALSTGECVATYTPIEGPEDQFYPVWRTAPHRPADESLRSLLRGLSKVQVLGQPWDRLLAPLFEGVTRPN